MKLVVPISKKHMKSACARAFKPETKKPKPKPKDDPLDDMPLSQRRKAMKSKPKPKPTSTAVGTGLDKFQKYVDRKHMRAKNYSKMRKYMRRD